jgi:hypothetical protein
MGRIHEYGDRRLPLPGALGTTAALTAITAALAGRPAAAATAAGAVIALATWLIIYLRISAPINRTLTAAAKTGNLAPGARAPQRRWDGVITCRACFQLEPRRRGSGPDSSGASHGTVFTAAWRAPVSAATS